MLAQKEAHPSKDDQEIIRMIPCKPNEARSREYPENNSKTSNAK